MCDLAVRGDNVFQNFGICAAHIFDETYFAAKCHTEDFSGCKQFLVDNSIYSHIFGELDIFYIFDFSDRTAYSEFFCYHTGQNIGFIVAGHSYESIIIFDILINEKIRITTIAIYYNYIVVGLFTKFETSVFIYFNHFNRFDLFADIFCYHFPYRTASQYHSAIYFDIALAKEGHECLHGLSFSYNKNKVVIFEFSVKFGNNSQIASGNGYNPEL